MKRPLVWRAWAALAVALLTASCGESGAKAIAYGDDLGQDWNPPAGAQQLRIGAENYFTRDVVVVAIATGLHYELTVGPIRKRYMIVPDAHYEITAYTHGDTGMVKLEVDEDNRHGAKGLWVKIRP